MEPTNPREGDDQNLEGSEPLLTENKVNEEQPSEVNQNEDDQINNTAPNDPEQPEDPNPAESNPEEAQPAVQESNEEPPAANIEQEEQPVPNEAENVQTAIDEEANVTEDKPEENIQEEPEKETEENQEIENEAPQESEQHKEQPEPAEEEAKPADDQIEEEKVADQIEDEEGAVNDEEEDQPVESEKNQEDNDEPFESGDAQEEEEEEDDDEEEESNRDENDQEEGTIREEKERQEGDNKDNKEGVGQVPGVPERRRPGRLPNKLKAQLAQKEAPIQTMSEAEKIYYSMESAKRFNNKLLANRLKLKDHMKQIEKARFVEDLPIEIASASFPSCFVPVYMYDSNGNEHFSMNQATQVERTSMAKFKKMNIENEGATLVPEQFNILGMGPNRRFQRRKKRRPIPVQRNSEDSD